MEKLRFLAALSACVLVLLTSTANAAVLPLEGRLPVTPGGTDYQAYYDPNLGITWAADANINGTDTWDNQVTWAAGLTIGGVDGWRLPSADVNGDGTVIDCFGGGVTGCEDNEIGYLRWEEGITATVPGPFSNVQATGYWFGTEVTSTIAWHFVMSSGAQGDVLKVNSFSAWAVYDGDVGVVPVPAAVWLFGSGLLGLIGMARRKTA